MLLYGNLYVFLKMCRILLTKITPLWYNMSNKLFRLVKYSAKISALILGAFLFPKVLIMVFFLAIA